MTLEIDGIDIIAAAQAAALIGGVVVMLVMALLFYLLVRPPRHVREAKRRPAEFEEHEAAQLLELGERIESRLEVLERALDQQQAVPVAAEPKLLETAEAGRETRRTK